ncbi:hypothetical protein BAR24066_05145 [Burkholderia arboris]|uniref:Uncharacterized protein n=1 Tax=Burkholderia arboris TaxID=488730 RepID=A0A9Q9SMI2_9BURK|nr:hypothetical protein BAR24066_05145 [Burkholderia arboris]
MPLPYRAGMAVVVPGPGHALRIAESMYVT